MRNLTMILPLLTILLGACSPPAEATTDLAAIQASAVAAASTMIGMTKAAIPPTPIPSSTFATTAPLIGVASGSPDPCGGALPPKPKGAPANISLNNQSSAQALISIYIILTKLGDCGYRSYTLPRLGSTLITDIPQACYSVYAFINDPNKPLHSSGGGCWTNPSRIYIVVTNSGVKLTTTHP